MRAFPSALLLVLLSSAALALADAPARADAFRRGFLLAVPKRLLAGSTERACVAFFNASGPAVVTLQLLRADSDARLAAAQHRVRAEDAPCLPLTVPRTPAGRPPPPRARLLVQARFENHYDYVVSAVREVRLQARPLLVFVQTDRAAYRPGERVRVRVLTLQHDLTAPQGAEGGVAAAWVASPSGVRLAQWTRPAATLGLVQLEFQLAPDPPLGEWTVNVQLEGEATAEHTAAFAVKEYVLPRFSVTIAGPRHVLADAREVAWEICARYAHGEPVRGRLVARAAPRVPAWRAAAAAAAATAAAAEGTVPRAGVAVEVEAQGCATLNATAAALGLRDWDASPSAITLTAEMTESGTGASANASLEASVEHSALRLSFLPGSPRYFKPGLPYGGSLRAAGPEGGAAAGLRVQLCLKARRRREWSRALVQCRNVTTAADGQLRFRVAPQPPDVQLLSLVATAIDYPTQYYTPGTRWRVLMDQPSAFFDVHAWYSPSGSFLEVMEGEAEGPKCGHAYNFVVFYTGAPPTSLRFLVTARGDIVQAGAVPPAPASGPDAAHPVVLGDAPSAARLSDGPPPGRLGLQIKVSARMAPASALLLYYARPDGEVVAASLTLRLDSCFANQVRASWSRARAAPGGEAALRVWAAPRSLCAVAAVDAAAAAMGNTLLTASAAFDALQPFHVEPFHLPRQADDVDYCARLSANATAAAAVAAAAAAAVARDGQPSSEPSSEPASEPAFWDLRRRRSVAASHVEGAPAAKFVDAVQAFDDAGVLVVSDMVLETRPCHWQAGANVFDHKGPAAVALARGSTAGVAGVPLAQRRGYAQTAPPPRTSPAPDAPPRTHFPETWLWDLLPMGNATSAELVRRLPDSVTRWEASVACVAPGVGLGVAPPAAITAFQPFFVDLVLPYSAKRGEVLLLRASLFNYLPHSLPVRVSLSGAPGLELAEEEGAGAAGAAGAAAGSGCVPANGSRVWRYRARATRSGSFNVTATAEVEPLLPEPCGPEVVVAQRDAVVKPLLVVPEGFPVHETRSAYICPANFSADSSVKWRLELPQDVVEDSARAAVSMVGDLLGPTLQNLDHLVRLPMGCGEQNMILFVPNLHVIGYLNATGRLDANTHTEALKNLQKGYQRQLNYRRADGSYSAFGEADSEGSLWLTAFVVRALAQARAHIFVDESDLSVSANWVLRQQLENGCFQPVGQVFHKDIRGGLSDDSPSALTAYVLLSLLESGLPLAPAVADNALFCLRADTAADPYALALKAHALATLKGHAGAAPAAPAAPSTAAAATGATEETLRRLLGAATRRDGLLWWEKPGGGNRALDVETTAYGVLALLRAGGPARFLLALDAVRWIALNTNARGGFVSTQDTVVALEALTRYASLVPQQRTALSLLVTATGLQDKFHIGYEERFVLQGAELPVIPTQIEVQAEGEGCALIQISFRYNVKTPSGSDAFELEVKTGPVASVDACAVQRVEACVRFKLPGQTSNMAVLEVNMVSGYTPDRTSLHHLAKSQETGGFKRWEEEEDKVNFYFDELTNKQNCVSFLIMQEAEVENPSFAVVTVYDYYQQELSLSQKYSTDAGCRNEKLPDPQPQATGNGNSSSLWNTHSSSRSASGTSYAHHNMTHTRWTNDSIPEHLNQEFVNVDHDLEVPDGIEGPVPSYALPQADFVAAPETEPEKLQPHSCPRCEDFPPKDLPHLYCNATSVYKLALKRGHARILLDMRSGRAPRRMRKNVVFLIPEACSCKLLNKVAGVQHVVLMDNGRSRQLRTRGGIPEQIKLDDSMSIFQIPVHPGQPEQIKQVRHTCV